MSHAEVVGYYERSKLWNESAPFPHQKMMQVLTAEALQATSDSETAPNLRLAEIGALPGREIVTPFGGAPFYFVDDEEADLDGVLFHDILDGPLDRKRDVVVGGLLLQEFTLDEAVTAISNIAQSCDVFISSTFGLLLPGVWREHLSRPPGMLASWDIASILRDAGFGRSVKIQQNYSVSADRVSEYIPHARHAASMDDSDSWKSSYFVLDASAGHEIEIVAEIWSMNNE